ncbi:DUF2484 family protein [Aliiroseovarius sp. YM-037]|uniref:DUF2484 family protein n=1 Tax=Aliiroseovarius sp. YM-037 TaxID=3341728 RepID=UPI003A80F41C
MTLSLILGAIWVVLATGVALLPMRHQYAPGLLLLLLAPFVILFIGLQHGVWAGLFGLFAFVSMFRNPLIYLYRRVRGDRPEIPR